MNTPSENKTSSVDLVLNNEDLIAEILLRVPAGLVLQFKLVSKKRYSLISHPNFKLLHTHRNCNLSCGIITRMCIDLKSRPLYLCTSFEGKYFGFPQSHEMEFINQSCNGLLLCHKAEVIDFDGMASERRTYYVVNPTTRKMAKLPPPPTYDLQLAFDPSKSPNYKVVCLESSASTIHVYVYSSETKVWKLSVTQNFDPQVFYEKVVWNGDIHWMSRRGDGMHLLLDQETFQTIPKPPIPNNGVSYKFKHYGESGDYLYFIILDYNHLEGNKNCGQYIIYAMGRDYSEWFVKYKLDVSDIVTKYQHALGSVPYREDMNMITKNLDEYMKNVVEDSISMCTLIDEKSKRRPFLVFETRDTIVSYNIEDKTLKILTIFDDWPEYYFGKYAEILSEV